MTVAGWNDTHCLKIAASNLLHICFSYIYPLSMNRRHAWIFLVLPLIGMAIYYDHSVRFYGEVVDQDGKPLPGALAKISIQRKYGADVLFVQAPQTTSGSDGHFSVSCLLPAQTVTAQASKAGYYTSQYVTFDQMDAKTYAQLQASEPDTQRNRMPTSDQPYQFMLHKIGSPVDLVSDNIESVGLFALDKITEFDFKPDGKMLLELSWENDGIEQSNRFGWQVRLEIPGGGLAIRKDSWDFVAPASGYQESVVMGHSLVETKSWAQGDSRQFFFKTSQGTYGRFDINVGSEWPENTKVPGFHKSYAGAALMNIYINPTGSRNLEPRRIYGY